MLAALPLDRIFGAFACPAESPAHRAGLLEEAVHDRAEQSVVRFLDRFRSELQARSDGLTEMLEGWSSSRFPTAEGIGLALAHLDAATRGDARDPVRAAAAAAAELLAAGASGEWRVELDRPARLRWSTRISRPARRIKAAGASGDITLRLDERSCALQSAHALPAADTLTVLMPWAHDLLPIVPEADASPRAGQEIASALEAALALLAAVDGATSAWVTTVVRDVQPIDSTLGTYQSRTHPEALGLVSLSFPSEPAPLGELLVHEASHQYYHLAEQLGPIHDGTDREMYWSPARRKNRPIDRILLAYHAFANILLYYQASIDAGLDSSGYCAHGLSSWRDEVLSMQRHLEKSRGLTAIGEALWRPLAERIA
jgi:HEXXH motif-containing protein